MSAVAAFTSELPKAELHLHLEGSVSPALFKRLCAKHCLMDAMAPQGDAWQFKDLNEFLVAYAQVCRSMRDAEDFRDATYETLERSARSRAQYVELFFSPAAHDETVMVLEHRPAEVIGIGLDYSERPHPPAQFAPLFAEARRQGLEVTAHAGEDGPAAYVRDAVELLGCRRIDHGYHIVEDPELMARCRELDILFTVCPTTTLHTTKWRDLRSPEHAIRRMIEGNLRVCINTDDPGLFATDLNREYALVADAFGLSEAKLAEIAANGFSHNFGKRAP